MNFFFDWLITFSLLKDIAKMELVIV
jgi:hypothetical protein